MAKCWTRAYARRRGFPQVIHSSKRFAGPTGLEEYLGLGFGIALRVGVEREMLVFDSDHYFWRMPGRGMGTGLRLRLPGWLAPGRLRIGHVDLGRGRFAFTLDLTHPLAGRLIRQCCTFTEFHAGDPT